MPTSNTSAIILFDGVCNFCNRKINFVIKHDSKKYFCFAPLQSKAAKELKEQYHFPEIADTIILIENGQVYTHSTAALRIAHKLKFPANAWYVFIIIPPFFRNVFYNYIARNRYKWWGKKESCMIPTESEKSRFLS